MLLIMLSTCSKETVKNPVNWSTNRVSLEADDFFIIAADDTFYANVDTVDVDSDPGDSAYCTLELIWQEKNVEMRLFIYFISDGTDWWSEEFRTYNGQHQADWIYYYGTFFKSPLGLPYTHNFEQASSDTGNTYTGKIYFENLRLQAFLAQ